MGELEREVNKLKRIWRWGTGRSRKFEKSFKAGGANLSSFGRGFQ